MKTVFVTGGAGYVGSHACKAFSKASWNVVVYDNLSRGWRDAVRWGPLIEGDILDREGTAKALKAVRPDLVAHFAAFAYVGESVEDPSLYYRNNTSGSLNLLDAMRDADVGAMLFSSTCATYGPPVRLPIDETHPQSPINPYGWSKFVIERMLEDYGRAYGLRSVALRYFNAAGCDPDGEIGEHHVPETHAIPLAIDAALKDDAKFTVMGTDFDTCDGSAVRDYIHVADLARAHLLAGEYVLGNAGSHIFNLGTGVGTTVVELLAAVEKAAGRAPNAVFGPRRAGDPAALVASFAKARDVLGWTPQFNIDDMVASAVAWQRRS
jgi:UDP-arabinose 4-epimerase